MRLPFLRLREPQADRPRGAAPIEEPTAIAAARTRARQRLAGALVLLVIGVVGFPILFETQPRPLPLNTPIVSSGTGAAAPAADPVPVPRPVGVAPPVLPPADAGVEAAVPVAAVVTPVPPKPESASPRLPAPAASAAPRAAVPAASALPRAAAPIAAAATSDAASAAKPARFVVQVGAFSEPNALRDVRQKVEKLGYKTYTQDIVVDGGKRTRVRVGPYESRDEAESAAAKLKRAGLGPAVLTL